MKNSIKCLSVVCVVLAACWFARCTKEDMSLNADACKVAFAVDETRTEYELTDGGGAKVSWLAGDVIYVSTSDGTWGSGYSTESVKPKIFTYNAQTGLFEGDATLGSGEYTFRAQYAVESQRTYLLSTSATNLLSSSQQQTSEGMSHVKEYDCMVAETTATVDATSTTIPALSMKHLYSFIKIIVKNETGEAVTPTSLTFKVNGVELNGIFTINDLQQGGITAKSSNSDTTQLNLSDIQIASGKSFAAFIVVAPFADFTGDIDITVATSTAAYKLTKKMSGFTVERAKLYSTSVTLNSDTLIEDDTTYSIVGGISELEPGKYLLAGYGSNGKYNFWTGKFGNDGTRTSGYMHTVACEYNSSTGSLVGADDAVEVELVKVDDKDNAYYICYNSKYVYSVKSGSYYNIGLGDNTNYYWTFANASSAGITATDNSSSLVMCSATTANLGVIRAYSSASSTGVFFFKKNSSESNEGGDDNNSDVEPTDPVVTPNPAIEGRTGWAELPQYRELDDCIYHFHSAADTTNVVRRNYSMCFCKSLRASYWIAYPLHSCYRSTLTRSDCFGYDPDVPSAYQAYMTKSYTGAYDRGHQLPNADRTCSRAMANQTFYATNMTPQASYFNQKGWADLESMVRGFMCADTLYVVTGAHFGDDWDSSIAESTTDAKGNVCPIPTHYYKVLLRTKVGTTGKSVAECSASDLKCVGFLYKHVAEFSSVTESGLCSVSDIENLTGFTFFVNVPNAPKDTFDKSEWGF